MAGTVISYPIPLYANFPISPQNYQPSQFFISSITLGQNTFVTTTVNHNYIVGQLVRMLIPLGSGTYELNEKTANVISIPAPNQVLLDIDSSKASKFIVTTERTQPQIVAVGDINSGQQNSNGITSQNTYVPGSFLNISL